MLTVCALTCSTAFVSALLHDPVEGGLDIGRQALVTQPCLELDRRLVCSANVSRSRLRARRRSCCAVCDSCVRQRRCALSGILVYSTEPLVSSDVIKAPFSAVVDGDLTTVVDGTQVKIVAWYDNEWGYSTRLAELSQLVLAPAPVAV